METEKIIKVGTNNIWIEWKDDSPSFMIGNESNCCCFFMDEIQDVQDALKKFDEAQAVYVQAKYLKDREQPTPKDAE